MSGLVLRPVRVASGERGKPGRVRWMEWIFPLALTAILLSFAWVPYREAFRRSSPTERFMGLVGIDAIDDNNVYLGLMRQAADGDTLFTNNFTPEPNKPALFNLLYLGLGRLARLTGWSLDFTHRVFGAISALLLVLSAYAFIAAGIRRARYRALALVLACFGGGFVWLAQILARATGFKLRAVDSWLVEVSLFHAVVVYPHFVFAAALLTGSLALLLKAEREKRFGPAVAGGLSGAALAASHAFEAVAVIPIALAYLLLDWMSRARIPVAGKWKCVALVAGLPIPMLALNGWILAKEPMWGNVVARLDFYTPDPFRLALGLGAAFFIALLTFEGFLRSDRPAGEQMAKAWVIVVLALAYVPWINWRWHLLNGVQIPLSVLAVQGLRRTAFRTILLRLKRRRVTTGHPTRAARGVSVGFAALVVVGICCLSSANLLLSYRHEVSQVEPPTYLPSAEVSALDWMRREVPRDALVFASYATGNYVPRLGGQRVFLGEDKLTERIADRRALAVSFFSDGWTDARRNELLARFGVNYLFYGPEEKKLGPYNPLRAAFLRRVYDREGVQIFRVEGRGGTDSRAFARVRSGKGAP